MSKLYRNKDTNVLYRPSGGHWAELFVGKHWIHSAYTSRDLKELTGTFQLVGNNFKLK